MNAAVKTQVMDWKIGDRFIFMENLSTSDSVQIGYKGVVEEILNNEFVFCDGWAFQFDEIKKLVRA